MDGCQNNTHNGFATCPGCPQPLAVTAGFGHHLYPQPKKGRSG